MLFSSLIASALLASGALAQYDYGYGSSGSSSSAAAPSGTAAAVATGASESSPSPSGMVNVHVIQVSDNNGTLRFFPDDIKADAGSMVQFQFHPKVCHDLISL
jgi:plastocyanin